MRSDDADRGGLRTLTGGRCHIMREQILSRNKTRDALFQKPS